MFSEAVFPACPNFGFQSQPWYSVTVVQTIVGKERRNRNWLRSLQQIECQVGPRDEATVEAILTLWHAMGGEECGFRFKDYTDYKSCPINAEPGPEDQGFIPAPGGAFQMVKTYTVGARSQQRLIQKPVNGTISMTYDALLLIEGSDYTVNYTSGHVECALASDVALLKWGGEFDVPVRFNSAFPVDLVDLKIQSVQFTLIEVRDIDSSADEAGGSPGGGSPGGGPPTTVTDFTVGIASVGPWGGTPLSGSFSSPIGDGSGYYDGSNNDFNSAPGSIAPVGAVIAGHIINAIAWQGGPTPVFMVVVSDTVPQSMFNSIHIGGSYNQTFNTASADMFDNVSQAGFTVWMWHNTDEFSVSGNYPVTIT